jgi:hypothetical protein
MSGKEIDTSLIGKKRRYIRVDFDCETNNIKEELNRRKHEVETRIFLELLNEKIERGNIDKNNNKIIELANNVISKPIECYKSVKIPLKYTIASLLGNMVLPFQSSSILEIARIGGTLKCLTKDIYNRYFN